MALRLRSEGGYSPANSGDYIAQRYYRPKGLCRHGPKGLLVNGPKYLPNSHVPLSSPSMAAIHPARFYNMLVLRPQLTLTLNTQIHIGPMTVDISQATRYNILTSELLALIMVAA